MAVFLPKDVLERLFFDTQTGLLLARKTAIPTLFGDNPVEVYFQRGRGLDKINQLRYVRFLKNEAGILQLMDKHRALIAPKFQKVLDIFGEKLAHVPNVAWSKAKGGYFISPDVPQGCAQRVIALAKEAGVELPPAGATYPHGKDPDDPTIRIAPTFPELPEVTNAAEGVAACVQVAAAEKRADTRWQVCAGNPTSHQLRAMSGRNQVNKNAKGSRAAPPLRYFFCAGISTGADLAPQQRCLQFVKALTPVESFLLQCSRANFFVLPPGYKCKRVFA